MSWVLPKPFSKSELTEIKSLAKITGLHQKLIEILWRRGLTTEAMISDFLNPTESDSAAELFHEKLIHGQKQAAELIAAHATAGGKFLIYGDYDVDGISSTTIIWRFLYREVGAEALPFVPHRLRQGYGMNLESIREIVEKNRSTSTAKLMLITVDCGIKDFELIETLKTEFPELKVIITDHHRLPDGPLPNADAIVHPLLPGSEIEPVEICAAEIAWILTLQIAKELKLTKPVGGIELAVLGTVCDVMPLTGWNRKLVKAGLKKYVASEILGLNELIRLTNYKNAKKITTYQLGFQIGPRLNAAGRIGEPLDAVRLLSSDNQQVVKSLSEKLHMLNSERQQLTQTALDVIKSELAKKTALPKLLIFADESWEEGIIGLIAGKIHESTGRPTIAFTLTEGGHWVGSARSNSKVDITGFIGNFKDSLLRYGGHTQAAGLSIDSEVFAKVTAEMEAFADKNILEDMLTKEVHIDDDISPEDISFDLINQLNLMEPFGNGNPKPKFYLKLSGMKEKLARARFFGKNQEHFAMPLLAKTTTEKAVEIIWFNHDLDRNAVDYQFIGTLDYNEFRDKITLQYIVSAAKSHD